MSNHDSVVIAQLIGVTGFVDGMDDVGCQRGGEAHKNNIVEELGKEGVKGDFGMLQEFHLEVLYVWGFTGIKFSDSNVNGRMGKKLVEVG